MIMVMMMMMMVKFDKWVIVYNVNEAEIIT